MTSEPVETHCVDDAAKLYAGFRAVGPLWSGALLALPGAFVFASLNYSYVQHRMETDTIYDESVAEYDYSPAALLNWDWAQLTGAFSIFLTVALTFCVLAWVAAPLHRRIHGIAAVVGGGIPILIAVLTLLAGENQYYPKPIVSITVGVALTLLLFLPSVIFGTRLFTGRGWMIAAAKRFRPRSWRPLGVVAYITGLPPTLYAPHLSTIPSWVLSLVGRALRNVSLWGVLFALPWIGIMLQLDGSDADAAQLFATPLIWGGALLAMALFFTGFSALIMRRSLDDARRVDGRRPVLYLRPFADDHVSLRRGPRSFLGWLSGGLDDPRSLEELLAQNTGAYGPVVAIGNPRDKLPKFGAARAYIRGDDWQSVAHSLMEESQLIVLCVSESEGMLWEIQQTIDKGWSTKTIYVMHPELSDGAASGLLRRMGLMFSPDPGERILAAVPGDRPRIYCARKVNDATVACALQLATLDRLGSPPAMAQIRGA